MGVRASGVYTVNWMGREKKEVRCNMDLEGGGWLVFFRRTNDFVQDFNKEWDAYKTGFGDLQTEFWFGNEFLHEITSCRKHSVLVWGQKSNGISKLSIYESFKIGNEVDGYRLTYNQTLKKGIKSFEVFFDGEDRSIHNMKFSTMLRDQDIQNTGNCAVANGGGFWYSNCGNLHLFRSNLIRWKTFNDENGLKEAQIMIKEEE